MELVTLNTIITIIFSIVIGMGAFIIKGLVARIEDLERAMRETTTDTAVRLLLADKLDPMKEDIHEIKENVKKLFELYVQHKRDSNE